MHAPGKLTRCARGPHALSVAARPDLHPHDSHGLDCSTSPAFDMTLESYRKLHHTPGAILSLWTLCPQDSDRRKPNSALLERTVCPISPSAKPLPPSHDVPATDTHVSSPRRPYQYSGVIDVAAGRSEFKELKSERRHRSAGLGLEVFSVRRLEHLTFFRNLIDVPSTTNSVYFQ